MYHILSPSKCDVTSVTYKTVTLPQSWRDAAFLRIWKKLWCYDVNRDVIFVLMKRDVRSFTPKLLRLILRNSTVLGLAEQRCSLRCFYQPMGYRYCYGHIADSFVVINSKFFQQVYGVLFKKCRSSQRFWHYILRNEYVISNFMLEQNYCSWNYHHT